ncbi:hypothetical protein [Allostreptomyces psammosilenae]|uniref:GH18 domain-containing protein n=1 Tax=Allostreptomyces psammosilenae TaxID=1892865 RepID=A0A852ZUM9_9ACTN|nr:hypothetical protein [Allostreptomyces psammosilenae]NYI05625.1 hypothetical protein [Allostreptomyces psammosilenae]
MGTEDRDAVVTSEVDGVAPGPAAREDDGGPATVSPEREAAGPRRRVFTRRRALAWSAGVGGGLLLPPTAAAGALRAGYSGTPDLRARTRGRDAVWLGHAWVDGRRTDADVASFLRPLSTTGIRDLYVHTGPLENDGTLRSDRYPRAEWLIAAVREALPGVRVQSWLGQHLATEYPGGLDLDAPRSRENVLGAARQVLRVGFDGVHYDLEPLHSGGVSWLELMDATWALTREQGRVFSVAVPQIDPLPGLHTVAKALFDHPKWWSQEYFAQTARRADQVAVMSYDTAMVTQGLYGGYVAQQTRLALEVTPPEVDLLMGLPAYHDNTLGHRESAETVAAAIRGVRLELGRRDVERERFGVALYVDFAATEQDWRSYREGWVEPPR